MSKVCHYYTLRRSATKVHTVRQSETTLSLASVLASVSSASLTDHLNQLRRDLTQHYVEYVARQPVNIDVSSAGTIAGAEEYKLIMFPSPPESQDLVARLDNLSTVLTFLDEHLFPHLSSAERRSFLLTLCRPVRAAVLNHILIPAVPSSLSELPQFLDLVKRAQKFELDYLSTMLGDDGGEQEISSWANNVGMHYERKRRMQLLEAVRIIVMSPEDERKMFAVDIEVKPEFEEASHVPPSTEPAPVVIERGGEEDAWGFDEEEAPAQTLADTAAADDDGWGFGDEEPADAKSASQPRTPSPPPVPDEDPDDAWGLNDDDSSGTLNDDEDDPWNDGWGDEKPKQPAQAPKPARGLAKLTSKGKNGAHKADIDPSIQSPIPVAPPPPTPLMLSEPQQPAGPPPILKETYMVSGRTQELLEHVEAVLREGEELVASGLLASHRSAASPTGSVVLQAAPLTLDVFRAVYPVTFSAVLLHSPKQAMRFSNDCLYLSTEVRRVRQALKGLAAASVSEKLQECCERLKLLGESWYSDSIVSRLVTVVASSALTISIGPAMPFD